MDAPQAAGCGKVMDRTITSSRMELSSDIKFKMIDQHVAGVGAKKKMKGSNKRNNCNGRRKTDWLMHEYITRMSVKVRKNLRRIRSICVKNFTFALKICIQK